MSKGGKPNSSSVFDFERIREVIKLMEQHDLSEIDLQQGDDKIKLCRATAAPAYVPPAVAMPVPAAASAAAASDSGTGADTAGTITINVAHGRHLLRPSESRIGSLRESRLDGQRRHRGLHRRSDESF